MNTRYHNIPTYRRQILLTAGILIVYLSFLYFAKFTFSDVSGGIRRYCGQAGLFLVFAAGLLAGLPFYWDAKAKEDFAIAQQEIEYAISIIDLLAKLQKEIGSDFSNQFLYFEKRKVVAEGVLQKVNNYPRAMNSLGAFSLFLLAVGTICQVVSLG